MRRFLSACLGVVLSLGVTACGGGSDEAGDPSTDKLAQVESRGTLVGFFEPDYAPQSLATEGATRPSDTKCSDNQLTGAEVTGYDIEVTKPGYKPTRKQIKQTEWNVPVSIASGGCSMLLGTPLTVVGAVPLVGLFWARQLPERVVVSMDRAGPAPAGDPNATAPSSYGY